MSLAEQPRPAFPEPSAPELAAPDPDASFARWVEARRRPILILAALAALLWTILFLQFTVDDAFISFRYGKNLVAHHIWNWNPSGPHEEAYTSALYTLLAIIPAILHLSPAMFFKFIGLGCIVIMIHRMRTLAGGLFASLLGILLIAINPFVWINTYSSLETPLYMLLIVEMALCVKRAKTVSPAWVYALFLLLPLTRPEGFVFACAGVILFCHARGDSPKHLAWLGASALLGLAYFLARWRYFHHLLPNPLYAKTQFGTWRGLVKGFSENLGEFSLYFFITLLVFLIARKPVTRVFAACSFLLLLFLFAPNAMPQNYADRFYLQLTFPIFLVFLLVEDVVRIARIAAIVAGIFLIALSPGALMYAATYFPILKRAQVDLGQRLAPFAENHTVFAGEAGAIPYYSNWVTVDFLGLGTNGLGWNSITVAQLQRIHPDLILLFGNSPGPEAAEEVIKAGPFAANQVILKYLRQSNEYDYAGASRGDGFYMVEFLRKVTPQHDQILATLQQNTETSATTEFSVKDLLLQRYVPWSR